MAPTERQASAVDLGGRLVAPALPTRRQTLLNLVPESASLFVVVAKFVTGGLALGSLGLKALGWAELGFRLEVGLNRKLYCQEMQLLYCSSNRLGYPIPCSYHSGMRLRLTPQPSGQF